MKRRMFWIAWALVPVALIALHFSAGPRLMAHDRAGAVIRAGLVAVDDAAWADAASAFGAAKGNLAQDEHADAVNLAILEAKARIQAGELTEAQADLETLLEDEEATANPDPELITQLRNEVGTAAYFSAWLMRLDGASADEWKPETEKARQQFRLLSEEAGAKNDPKAETFKKNLEAVIKLQQMDLSILQALPLPKKCPNGCNSLCQKKRDQRLSKCKNGKKPGDARKEIKSDSAGGALNRGVGS